MISYGVPQGSVGGTLLFLIYINDLNEAISHSLIHHFAYDTNILFSNKSLKKISKYNNHDLAQIVQWLRAKRISLNSNKTEIILFWPNFRVSGQKIEPVKQTKYLGIYFDEHLTCNFQISQIKSKWSRISGLLSRLGYYVKSDLLQTVYFAIFDSILRYGIQVWGQSRNQGIKDIEKIQEKTIQILNFKWKNDPVNPLFKNSKIMKMKDILTFNNCLFVYDQINEDMPFNFEDFFSTSEN